jgi:hypothetical protein
MRIIKFDVGNEIRAIARERIGIIPRRRVMVPKNRKPPKYKEKYEGHVIITNTY